MGKSLESDEEIIDKIRGMLLVYYGTVALGHLTALFLLNSLGLLNQYTLIVLPVSWFSWVICGRRILRSYLNEREEQVLDRYPELV